MFHVCLLSALGIIYTLYNLDETSLPQKLPWICIILWSLHLLYNIQTHIMIEVRVFVFLLFIVQRYKIVLQRVSNI